MTDLERVEQDALEHMALAARGAGKRGRATGSAVLVKPMSRRLSASGADVSAILEGHAALEVKEVEAPRLLGLFRRTRLVQGIALRGPAGIVERLQAGAPAPATFALRAAAVAALAAAQPAPPAADFAAVLPGTTRPPRSLEPLLITGAERVDVSREAGNEQASRAKSVLARLRRFAPGSGFEFNDRLRVNSPMAALEVLLQGPPQLLGRALDHEELERWMRDDCKERELADLLTATRLRAAAEHLDADSTKRLFVRLLAFSPVREGVAMGIVPLFVGRLTTAGDAEIPEIVRALEGLGTESVLEALVRAVYEVSPEARPRVLMALGAVGSARVLDPLERLALHAKVKSDRLEAAAAICRIAERAPGPRCSKALATLAASEDPEVKAMLAAKAG